MIVEDDVHAALAEQIVRVGAGAEQKQVRDLTQQRQCCEQQMCALATADATGYEQAQAIVRRACAGDRCGAG